jgi:hypothetical protein
MKPRIYADFQNLDDSNRLRLTCKGTLDDLKELQLRLCPGLEATFYMDDADDAGNLDDILVDGIVEFNQQENIWVGAVDWSDVYHQSDLIDQDAAPHDPHRNGASTPTIHREASGTP